MGYCRDDHPRYQASALVTHSIILPIFSASEPAVSRIVLHWASLSVFPWIPSGSIFLLISTSTRPQPGVTGGITGKQEPGKLALVSTDNLEGHVSPTVCKLRHYSSLT